MWLSDFLQKDFPNCRTMIFGYRAKIQTSMKPLHEYGNGLEAALLVSRSTKEVRSFDI